MEKNDKSSSIPDNTQENKEIKQFKEFIIENEKKEKIILAAAEVFSEKGFHGTSIADIASKLSNLGKSSIFYHFGTKIQLASAVIFYYFNEMEKNFDLLFKNIKDPFIALEKIIDSMLEFTEHNAKMTRFLIEILTLIDDDSDLSDGPNISNPSHTSKEHKQIHFRTLIFDYFNRYGQKILELLIRCNIPSPQNRMLILMSSLDGIALFLLTMSKVPNSSKKINKKELLRGYKKELLNLILSDSRRN